ncbi:MAG: hypothetical protein JNL17_05800 [Cyclobacteriaceae bacterium]|nr:hypothetical protein [Cyclobacteriaceae bacterium]
MKFVRYFLAIILTSSLLVFISCGSKENKQDGSNEFAKAQESLQGEIKAVVYQLPPPTEIPYMLQAAGADFNGSLINDKNKADQYTSQPDKAALNLGVYAADIGYLSSYDKTQDAIDYLNAARKLADNLGLVGSFDAEVLKRFESNIANKDSLANIINKTLDKSDKYLQDGSRAKQSALVLTGSFTEGLYIATGIVKTYPKDILPEDSRNLILTPLMRNILDQRKSVDEVVKMLSGADQNEPIPGLLTDFKALQASYAALNIDEQIRNNKANLVLSDKNLVEITAIVERIRKSIVQ